MSDSKHHRHLADFFDRHSVDYADFYMTHTRSGAAESFRTRLGKAVELLAGKRGALLDCATGSGEITQAVNASGDYHTVWANDISAGMLRAAKETVVPAHPGQEIRFVHSDIFDIESVPDLIKFDVILCLGLISYVGRLDELLAMFKRILNPGGVVIFQTTIATQPFVRLTRVVNDRRVAAGRINHIHYFSVPQIVDGAQQAGFRFVAERRFGLGLPFGDKLLRRLNYHLERAFARRVHRHASDALLVFELP